MAASDAVPQAVATRWLDFMSDDPDDLRVVMVLLFDQMGRRVEVAQLDEGLFIAYDGDGLAFKPDARWMHNDPPTMPFVSNVAINWLKHLTDEKRLAMCSNPMEGREGAPNGYHLQMTHQDGTRFMLTLKPAWV